MRRILRFAIVLLGLQLSFEQLVKVGTVGLAIIAVTLAATFTFTMWLGRRLGIDRKLAQLIAAGTSICGASAVIATNTVTRASDEDVTYAVACVTVFGSASMLLYPALESLVRLGPHAFGLWAGASIHEIAQVVAAAFQNGTSSGHFGTIAKLSRVMLLAPMILALSYLTARDPQGAEGNRGKRPTTQSVPMPWFVLGFIAMMLFNSFGLIPHADKTWLVSCDHFPVDGRPRGDGARDGYRQIASEGLEAAARRRWVLALHFDIQPCADRTRPCLNAQTSESLTRITRRNAWRSATDQKGQSNDENNEYGA